MHDAAGASGAQPIHRAICAASPACEVFHALADYLPYSNASEVASVLAGALQGG